MKIDRLIGIITVLQQNKKVTAPYLKGEADKPIEPYLIVFKLSG
jgi:predicted DNA-binding transcriptional regulator YafY